MYIPLWFMAFVLFLKISLIITFRKEIVRYLWIKPLSPLAEKILAQMQAETPKENRNSSWLYYSNFAIDTTHNEGPTTYFRIAPLKQGLSNIETDSDNIVYLSYSDSWQLKDSFHKANNELYQGRLNNREKILMDKLCQNKTS